MKRLLVLVPDLLFSTRIGDAARRLGYNCSTVTRGLDYKLTMESEEPDLIILTFDRTGADWERLAEAANGSHIPVIAFGSHMNTAAFARAKELGCAQVLANSRMASELPRLLQKYLG